MPMTGAGAVFTFFGDALGPQFREKLEAQDKVLEDSESGPGTKL